MSATFEPMEDDLRAVRAGDRTEAKAVQLISGAEIRPQPIEWLWPDWIAAGKLHILAGAPGTGKTTLALALAAALTTERHRAGPMDRQYPQRATC